MKKSGIIATFIFVFMIVVVIGIVLFNITVDGTSYSGTYALNDSAWSDDDENPKYNFKVTNLTSTGEIEVFITKK